jgi:hypothetical protein
MRWLERRERAWNVIRGADPMPVPEVDDLRAELDELRGRRDRRRVVPAGSGLAAAAGQDVHDGDDHSQDQTPPQEVGNEPEPTEQQEKYDGDDE